MRKLASVSVVATLVAGVLVGFASPGHAVHGCILASPSPGPVADMQNVGPDQCTFAITPGGAYNISVAAQDWSVTVTQGNTSQTFTDENNGPVARVEAVSAANSGNGGTITASLTNGAMVVGCAACEPPA